MTIKQESIHSHRAVERAIDELRRQWGVTIRESNGHGIANYPIEFLTEELLTALRSPGLRVLITAARARMLGLAEQDTKIDAEKLSLTEIMSLADPLVTTPPPSGLTTAPASEVDSMALKLAKYAALLPALLLIQDKASAATTDWPTLSVSDLQHYIRKPMLDVMETARATLPIEGAEKSRIVSFRSRGGSSVHLALIIGDSSAEVPLVRIHSSCVTGDILGSLRCDCGDQLKLALSEITKAGSGILIYLHQEGRGIGITNKLRAYQLQERGIDTYEANLMLGFEEDERDFSIAAAILKHLNISRIRLLTNNPQKKAAIEKAGITVTERVALAVKTGRHNHAYLDAKEKKAGHLF